MSRTNILHFLGFVSRRESRFAQNAMTPLLRNKRRHEPEISGSNASGTKQTAHCTASIDVRKHSKLVDINKARSVLVLMLDKHVGNVVVALQVIRGLQESLQGKQLFFVFNDHHRDLVEAALGADTGIVLYPRRHIESSPLLLRLPRFVGFAQRIRGLSADIVIDLVGNNVSTILAWWSRAQHRITPSRKENTFAFNQIDKSSSEQHRVFTYANIVRTAGVTAKPIAYQLRPTEQHKVKLDMLLKADEITPGRRIVCMHPGAGKAYKQWSWQSFEHIATWLIALDYDVALIGTNDDSVLINKIRNKNSNHMHDFNNRLSLGLLIALIERSEFFIGNDSGPMHLAAIIGIPVVALFGPTDERRWGPLSDNAVIVRGNDSCDATCRRGYCVRDFQCLRSITPELVKRAIRERCTINRGST